MMKEDPKKSNRKYLWIGIIAAVVVVVLWSSSFYMLKWGEAYRGTFGDMFGAVNALFSGLAFAGIILTIYMQREELALQRKELEETRGVFEKQSLIMSNQQNDAQFFNLLENHRQMVHSFDKKRNHYQRAGGGQRIYNKELESGYQFLSNIAEMWREYLTVYSEMQKMKILYDITILKGEPIDLIFNDENIGSFVDETTHLAAFVHRKFGGTNDFEFYNNTLSNSLLESEKFILSAWYDIKIGNKSRSPFGLELYNSYEFIDFNKYVLPEFSIGLYGEGFSPNHFEIKCNGVLLNYFTVIDHTPNDKLDSNIEVCSKKVDLINGILSIAIIDYLRGSSLEIETIQVQNDKLISLRRSDHHIIIEIMFNDIIYYVPIKFEIEGRNDLNAKRNDQELYNLSFKWNETNSISKEKAMEVIEIVKSKITE